MVLFINSHSINSTISSMNHLGSATIIATMLMTTPMAMASARQAMSTSTPAVPVLTRLASSPAERIVMLGRGQEATLKRLTVDLSGTSRPADVTAVSLYLAADSIGFPADKLLARVETLGRARVELPVNTTVSADTTYMWVGVTLRDSVDLSHRVALRVVSASTDRGNIKLPRREPKPHRIGVAVRRKGGEDGVASSRIPGLATAADGTLLAVYDARYDSSRDLQGNIDIALQRSTDGGATWLPMQRVLDMGCWGGLPEKYNGVSDATLLVDRRTGRIFVAGLWMHGALDADGKWIEGLNDKSKYWIHQWKARGSQPGTGVKQTCQFLITQSDDNGLTWSFPHDITPATKRPEWWLYAPAPGQGITLSDGTLVLPTQGRDSEGLPFSNITYSRDGGKSWTASNPAYSDVTECNAVELTDGTVMLNMRDNRNRGHIDPNGRRVCTTTDLGTTWTEHPTSRRALIEPTCMASLHRHDYTDAAGRPASVLLFANPPHHKLRKNLTLKASFDDGLTWPESHALLFDETKGFGYSSITSVDPTTIGILYESGLADLVFIRLKLNEILSPQTR